MKLPSPLLLFLALAIASCVPAQRPNAIKATSAQGDGDASANEDDPDLAEDMDTGNEQADDNDNPSRDEANDDNGDKPAADKGDVIDETPAGSQPLTVPVSQKVVYRPLGLTSGGYQKIKEAVWPDKCVKGDIVHTTGALFPFNETQTLVVRGPLVLSDLVIYRKKDDKWTKLSDLSQLKWQESNYGSIKNFGTYPMKGKVLENGRELYTQLPETGEKIIVARLKMPHATGAVYNSGAQDNVPALWMLNSRLFEAPSAQYFCNCRGVGNPGGCGELDIAEIIPEKKNEVTTTLYSYEGARGAVLSVPRPTQNYQIYAAVLRTDGAAGEVAVVEAASFDFTVDEFPDSFVSRDWLPTARSLNKGAEALNKP